MERREIKGRVEAKERETIRQQKQCWVCNERGKGLCASHRKAAEDRAARYNLSFDDAVNQLGWEAR